VSAQRFDGRAPRHRPRSRRCSGALALLTTLAITAGCARSARPGRSEAMTAARAEVELAERAELARDHLTARGHYERAARDAARAGDTAAERFARREFADTLLSWGEVSAARHQLERIVALSPRDAASWHDLGMVRHGDGDVPAAIAALATAAQLAPADARPRIALAALLWRHDQRDAARQQYQALLRLELAPAVRAKVEWALEQLAR
jgi:tetratricopeptide (TPR) repeat protein